MRLFFQSRPIPFILVAFTLLSALCLFSFWPRPKQPPVPPTSAARSELVNSSRDQKFQKFSLTGFDDRGKTFWNLEGDAAKVDPGQTIFLDQNVVLKLRDNTVVRTDHVQWMQNGGLLRTQALVYVDHEGVRVKGLGAVGRPNESFIQLNRNIEMVISGTTKITCSGPMKVFYNENKMIFFRKVKVTDERGSLSANRMDVLFDPGQKKISQIIAVGNVVIERGSDTTHSQRAIYTLANGSVRLEGNPEVTLHKGGTGILDGSLRS